MGKALDHATNIKSMKMMNRSLVIRTIRSHEPLARADIVKLTDLSPTTVSTIANELIEEGLVREGDEGESSGGRKPIMLHLNPSAAGFLGVVVEEHRLRGAVADLSGEPLFEREASLAPGQMEPFLDQLITLIQLLEKDATARSLRVLGASVAVPGILARDGSVLLYSALLQMRDVPLVERVQPHFSFPLLVENDMNLAALGEHSVGAGKGIENLIYVWADTAIGSGFVIHGRLYAGHNHSAGEFGHLVIDPNGPRCSCGSRGCLNTFFSEPALVVSAFERIKMGATTMLTEVTDGPLDRLSLDHILDCARDGDRVARSILERGLRYLGYGIANLFSLHDPEAVILYSRCIEKVPDFCLSVLQKTIRETCLPHFGREVRILQASLGTSAGMRGIARLFFDRFTGVPEGLTISTALGGEVHMSLHEAGRMW